MRYLIFSLIALFISSPVLSHPGRTDSQGCHTCRTNCEKWGYGYGEYHCHGSRPKTSPQPTPKKTFSCETDLSSYSHLKLIRNANLRASPSSNGKIIASLKTGTLVKKIQVLDKWVKVEFNGKTGWVYRCLVEGHNP